MSEVHRLIGSIVAAATSLELTLGGLVFGALTSCIGDGAGRARQHLIGMALRLLDREIGSMEDEERSGKAQRLGLLSSEDTAMFRVALAEAETHLTGRDDVVHYLWLGKWNPE